MTRKPVTSTQKDRFLNVVCDDGTVWQLAITAQASQELGGWTQVGGPLPGSEADEESDD